MYLCEANDSPDTSSGKTNRVAQDSHCRGESLGAQTSDDSLLAGGLYEGLELIHRQVALNNDSLLFEVHLNSFHTFNALEALLDLVHARLARHWHGKLDLSIVIKLIYIKIRRRIYILAMHYLSYHHFPLFIF